MSMVIRLLRTYSRLDSIYVYSLLFWQDCVNFMALLIVVYIRQSAMDALVGSVRELLLTIVSIRAL